MIKTLPTIPKEEKREKHGYCANLLHGLADKIKTKETVSECLTLIEVLAKLEEFKLTQMDLGLTCEILHRKDGYDHHVIMRNDNIIVTADTAREVVTYLRKHKIQPTNWPFRQPYKP